MATNMHEEDFDPRNQSTPEMINNDFDNEYQRSNQPDDFDPTLNYTTMNVITINNDQEKAFLDQASQVNLLDSKPMKRMKSPKYPRSIKSATKPSSAKVTATSTTSNRPVLQTDFTSPTTITKATSSTTKIEDNHTGKNLITVDTSKARSNLDVVRTCIRELGWKECSLGTILDSDIYWHSSAFHEGNVPFAFNSGRVNKFPGMNDLLRKVHLTRSLNNMRVLFPDEFDFYPKTWFLPEQSQQLKDDIRYIHQQDKKHNHSLTTFIVKPSDGSQGAGIYLLRDPASCMDTTRPHVVQEYIDRPLLINGLKFDLRIYVLILNLYPLEIFLYDEGLVRFATINYNPPTTENLHQTYMHLTNYSLNKRSSSYKHTFDSKQTDGSKRKLSIVWTQLRSIFGEEKIEETKRLIVEMINKTILAILPELRVEYEYELPVAKKQNISCFQIIGFDIILTNDLKPILLEVNANPSLRIDFDKENETGKLVYQISPIDEEIKKPLILETLKLALPKKKLHTLLRHAQLQINDELMTQRLEKVAQRRVEERNERIRSARKTRFDLKLNPLFSRPPDRKTQESDELRQEQIKSAKVHTSISTDSSKPNYTINTNKKTILKKSKKTFDTEQDDDDNESGSPTMLATETNYSNLCRTQSAKVKQPMPKSATHHHRSASRSEPLKQLQMIFPLNSKTKYQHLVLLDKIAYIYIQFVTIFGHKTMTSSQFRSFANICGIINETILAPSVDILHYQILRKWQQFVLRTPSTGLPFAAFIEAFFLLSQRQYPGADSLLDSVNQLVNICIRNMKSCLQTSSTQQSNQYPSSRTTPTNNSTNNRPILSSLPPPPSAPPPITRPKTAPSSARTISSDGKSKQSAKSVFPLFFDVL